MTLNEVIAEIEKADQENAKKGINMKGVISVVYDNYRIIGDADEIKRAVANYKKSTEVDLLAKEIDQQYVGCAYADLPDTVVCYIDRDKVPATGDSEDGEDEIDQGDSGTDTEDPGITEDDNQEEIIPPVEEP